MLVKIGNLDRAHGHFQSYLNFVQSTGSHYRPTQTHAFLKYQDFPQDFALFHRLVLTLLELPRESVVSVMVYEEFFGCIHALDSERYMALKAIYETRGRPNLVSRRKIYVICDWESVARFIIRTLLSLSLNRRAKDKKKEENWILRQRKKNKKGLLRLL